MYDPEYMAPSKPSVSFKICQLPVLPTRIGNDGELVRSRLKYRPLRSRLGIGQEIRNNTASNVHVLNILLQRNRADLVVLIRTYGGIYDEILDDDKDRQRIFKPCDFDLNSCLDITIVLDRHYYRVG